MDARQFQEELERQDSQFEATMKALEDLGNVGIAIPEEALRKIDEAFEVRTPTTTTRNTNCPGVRV